MQPYTPWRDKEAIVTVDVAKTEDKVGKEFIPKDEFEGYLDHLIRTTHPQINHPWVQMLFKGELTLDDLRVHALQFEHFLRFAPSHFLMIGANAEPHSIPDDDDMRRDAVQNLLEDMGHVDRSGDHFLIWRRFPYALGFTEEDMLNSEPAPTTLAFNYAYLYFLKNLTHPEALAFQQFANESVFALGLVDKRREALTKHYGLKLEDTWSPPTEEEAEHVKKPRAYVLNWADTPKRQARVVQLFKLCYALWQVYYDGIYNMTVGKRRQAA
jgi:pyrroloquinoline quinone (PQQ) biosynthesis protein C